MALVPASSHGAAAFNGGTITGALTITDPDGLTLQDTNQGSVFVSRDATSGSISGTGVSGTGGFGLTGDAVGGALSLTDNTNRAVEFKASGEWLRALAGTSTEWAVLAGGALVTGAHVAPADSALSAGECALWFDQTNGVGATKLMVKGKSADGTVKTATIVLA